MVQLSPVDLISLNEIRNLYFEEIRLPQELFLEWLVTASDCYLISDHQKTIGYCILSKDHILVEYYLIAAVISQKESIFNLILEQLSVTKAYCKSFDHIFLTCCHTCCKSGKLLGTMFRDYTNINDTESDKAVTVRLAKENDIPFLLTFNNSELYETPDELRFTVSNKMVYLFEKEKQLIGCGYLIRVLPDKNYYDIGMWTNPDFRKKGYATQIIAYLKKYCLDHGYIPVCGCAADNIASRKTLEKNGFSSRYCIIEFDF